MKKRVLKLHWCYSSNFGDNLNAHIFKKCFDVDVKYTNPILADAIGIGSISDKTLLTIREIPLFLLSKIFPFFFPKKPLLVLSSGIGAPFEHFSKKGRFLKSKILKRKVKPVVLRGKRTKSEFEKLLKQDLNEIPLGDFGLLTSELLDKKFEKIYDLGICPHFSQKDDPIFQEVLKEIPNSILLDTKGDFGEFIEKLAQCKTVISTAMHPLIACDSIGIPNLWVTVKGLENDILHYKCPDYYSALDMEHLSPIDIRKTKISPEFIIQNYKIDKNKVDKIKKEIFEAIKKALDEIC